MIPTHHVLSSVQRQWSEPALIECRHCSFKGAQEPGPVCCALGDYIHTHILVCIHTHSARPSQGVFNSRGGEGVIGLPLLACSIDLKGP